MSYKTDELITVRIGLPAGKRIFFPFTLFKGKSKVKDVC